MFTEILVELFVNAEPRSWVLDWQGLLRLAPNPNADSRGEVIAGALTTGEAERFEQHLRPLVDAGRGVKRSAFAYLRAVKNGLASQPETAFVRCTTRTRPLRQS